MTIPANITHLSNETLTDILARLPLRSISKCKSVCKTWKSTLESVYFRPHFLSLHKTSSSLWSLMSLRKSQELIGFHACKTWGLQRSLASFIPPSNHKASSNGLVLIEEVAGDGCCFVGSPVLQQWVKIPPAPSDYSVSGLLTEKDEDGVVLSFKVVKLGMEIKSDNDHCFFKAISVCLYSSESGIWTSKLIQRPFPMNNLHFVGLNGTIYLPYFSKPRALAALDCYPESDEFRHVHFPDFLDDNFNPKCKRALTTSGGFVMYVTTLAQEEETVFEVWRLNNDESWELLWEIELPIVGNYVPLSMHPFDCGIIYLWSRQYGHLVSCNLRVPSYVILRDGFNNDDHQDCFVDQLVCEKCLDDVFDSNDGALNELSQFVLPRWMEPVPCPPQAEIIDTTSLLSHITS